MRTLQPDHIEALDGSAPPPPTFTHMWHTCVIGEALPLRVVKGNHEPLPASSGVPWRLSDCAALCRAFRDLAVVPCFATVATGSVCMAGGHRKCSGAALVFWLCFDCTYVNADTCLKTENIGWNCLGRGIQFLRPTIIVPCGSPRQSNALPPQERRCITPSDMSLQSGSGAEFH